MEARPGAETRLLQESWKPDRSRTPLPHPHAAAPAAGRPAGDSAHTPELGSGGLYPFQQVEPASVHRLAGCDIALFRVFPVRYAPADGRFFFSPRVDVTVTVAPAAQPAEPRLAPRRWEDVENRIAPFVDNPDMLEEYRAARQELAPPARPAVDYLIVTTESLAPSYQALADRKTRAGLAVTTETMESIMTRFPGRDAAEKLRNCIRHAYTERGIRYVLLGGDVAAVPCRYAHVPRGPAARDSRLPCDLYFACLDGSWNRDGDDRWGETTDGEGGGDVDLLAEIDIGRAPVDTPAEAAAFVEKTIRHEDREHRDAGAVLLLASCLEQGTAQGGAMFDPLLPHLDECAVRRLDDRPHTSPQWGAIDAIRELNRSPRLVLYSGHGDREELMRLSAGDLESLSNRDPFLLYSVGCNPGQFDNDAFSPDSIGEELVKHPRVGAFAAILNVRWGWYDARQEWKYSGEFQIKFFEQLLAESRVDLGTACRRSRHEMLGQVEAGGIMPYRWCYYGITLFGDPHAAFEIPRLAQEPATSPE